MGGVLQGQRVTVLGAAVSGRAAARLALRLGAEVVLTDLRPGLEPLDGARCVFGRHEDADLRGADLVVVSPGVPAAAPPVRLAREAGVPVLGELGFAWRHVDQRLPVLAITGTNGKSTVCSFTGQLLQAAGRRPFVGGNLGTPLSEAVGGAWDALVVEVSSYQLELAGDFAPTAGVILNLTPDHLGRHGTMAGYAEAKARLFDHLRPGGVALVAPEPPELVAACAGRPGRRLWLGKKPGITLSITHADLDGVPLDLRPLRVMGEHNRWNAAVAALLALQAGLRPDALRLDLLEALAHRMQPVAERAGVLWINDSKATNIDATLVALRGLDRPAVVLLGGQGKEGADYRTLRAPLAAARRVLCFGQDGPHIAAALGDLPVETLPGLAAAVARARTLAQPGEAVLLSPACASFDEFRNFEHRGAVFSALAREEAP